ncbi:peptidoglycan DD-metalloendopeptidase family protein [Oceanicola sp. S124]|uniref:peptidoglycan DD-metalloendopeptidase family protein n=1 Tax=Oceanicola sp. S124 TaxID=1042378 RepID=UPI000255A9F3|nr:peptidoglycan DD-metalloendopeptidase family protein [Oceanicola sp. S124]
MAPLPARLLRLSLLSLLPFSLLPGAAEAEAPRLALPLDCQPGRDCFLQNYVDHAPGPDAQDFTCGPLSYDDHRGTDFALPSLAAMEAGVQVRAAAPGIVTGRRDGMIDRLYAPDEDARIDGRDCGNGVVIDHGAGWVTQYCHMRQGSVVVREGQEVTAGTPLGLVGLSGRSQFPHLHLSVRKDGADVDPFAPDGAETCGPRGAPLWSEPLDYVPGGLISLGFLDALPDFAQVRAGSATRASLPSDAPALVLWAFAFGVRQGDVLRLDIRAPDGPWQSQDFTLDRTQAQLFRATGKRLRQPLPPGLYTGRAALIRDGEILSQRTGAVQIRAD